MPTNTTLKARRSRAARLSRGVARIDAGTRPSCSSTNGRLYGFVFLMKGLFSAVGALAALSFVHRLHARHRDGVALFDQRRGERLGLRHLFGPRVTIAQECEGVV